jgi:hypothetical protein
LLSELLGDAVKHRAHACQDPRVAIREPKTRGAAVQPSSAPSLPPDAQTQIQAMMLERMREWLDEPVPMLGGKTPRQAARSQRGPENVTHLLIRQQQIFESGPGLPPIDLGEIWTELPRGKKREAGEKRGSQAQFRRRTRSVHLRGRPTGPSCFL